METKELKTRDLCVLFDVGVVTVYNWRKGLFRTAIPFHTRPRGTVRNAVYFLSDEVETWARANNVTMQEELFPHLGTPHQPEPQP